MFGTSRGQPSSPPCDARSRSTSSDRNRAATVVVQTVSVADETSELLALGASEPAIAGVVGWVDLAGSDVAALDSETWDV